MGMFTVKLEQFAKDTAEKGDQLTRACVFAVHGRLDNRSPVGDAKYWKHPAPKGYVGGRFRGNWQYGEGTIPAGETGRIDPSGDATRTAIIAAVPQDAAGKIHYLVNNVPYGPAIEEGHSRQAPSGVVGLTTIEWPQIVEQAAEGLGK